MATQSSSTDTVERAGDKIAPWASGDNLRYVEKEVLIPKIVREKAKVKCDDLVKGIKFYDLNLTVRADVVM